MNNYFIVFCIACCAALPRDTMFTFCTYFAHNNNKKYTLRYIMGERAE